MNINRTPTFRRPFWYLVALLGVAGPVAFVSAASDAPAAAVLTVDQKTALELLDGVMARFEVLLAKDDDASHKTATKARFDELKERCTALHKEYDQARYDELRVDLNLEYQRLASWMAPAKTPPAAATTRQK